MKKILVSGLINVETTVNIDGFPIEYVPIDYRFFGVETTVSGVGYNVVKALNVLGSEAEIVSIIGDDIYKDIIFYELDKEEIDTSFVLPNIKETPQSVVLYDNTGNRKIYLDLKDIQDAIYPLKKVKEIVKLADILVLCNVNFSRGLLEEGKKAGKLIASDVHVVDDIEDEYNKDFMTYADILFMSNENILGEEKVFIKKVAQKYNNEIIVIGMGNEGALIYTKNEDKITHMPAVKTRKIISTIGAGDALFSAFVYFYSQGKDPYYSLKKAMLFSSYKIGEKGGARGFLSEKELLEIEE